MRKFTILFLLLCSTAFAEDVAQYSGTTYLGCHSIGDTNVFLTNPNDYSTIKDGYIYLPEGCPRGNPKYLKVQAGQVVEMNQGEKTAVDVSDQNARDAAKASREAPINSIQTVEDVKAYLKTLVSD